MNVRIVIIYLKLLPPLARWKKADLSVPNVAVRKPKDCLMDLVFAVAVAVGMEALRKNITVHLPEVPAISVLCKRIIKDFDEMEVYRKTPQEKGWCFSMFTPNNSIG